MTEDQRQRWKRQRKRVEREGRRRGRVKEAREIAAQPCGRKTEEA